MGQDFPLRVVPVELMELLDCEKGMAGIVRVWTGMDPAWVAGRGYVTELLFGLECG